MADIAKISLPDGSTHDIIDKKSGYYKKPTSGITKSDLSTSVQSSLDKADSSPVNKSLTSENLDGIKGVGFYFAGGSNSVTNKPSGVDAFGLEVIRSAGGWYTQILYASNNVQKSYRRWFNGSSWTSWVEEKITDTNTWRGIQNNLTSDSTTDSLSAAQGKVLNGKISDLQTNFQAGVDGIYDTIVAQGTTPASKSLSDVKAGINSLSTNRYNSGYSAGNTAGYNSGKTDYNPTNATLSNAGALTVTNAAGTTRLTKTFTNSYDAGVTDGTNTTKVGTATAGDVLSGKTFTNSSGVGISGTMTNQGARTSSLNCGESYTIPTGYHNGSGKITANSLASQTSATATASDIKKGKTAWVSGNKLTGTHEEIFTTQEKTVTPKSSSTIVTPDTGYNGLSKVTVNGDSNLVPENIISGKTIFGVTGTATKFEYIGKTLFGMRSTHYWKCVIYVGDINSIRLRWYKGNADNIKPLGVYSTTLEEATFNGAQNFPGFNASMWNETNLINSFVQKSAGVADIDVSGTDYITIRPTAYGSGFYYFSIVGVENKPLFNYYIYHDTFIECSFYLDDRWKHGIFGTLNSEGSKPPRICRTYQPYYTGYLGNTTYSYGTDIDNYIGNADEYRSFETYDKSLGNYLRLSSPSYGSTKEYFNLLFTEQ